MKKNRLIALFAVVLCFSVLFSGCKLHRKVETEATEEEEEAEDETESETAGTTDSLVTSLMQVYSLDQFISDGSIFAENIPVPTATPIPVNQTLLGQTNEDDGYFSGPLENATILDNEYFRYTNVSVETTDEAYIINAQFENKSDIPYSLVMSDITVNNYAEQIKFGSEVVEPHKVLDDVTKIDKQNFPWYDGQEPTRISFLLQSNPLDKSDFAALTENDDSRSNYVAVNLFPQGEEAFHYEDPALSDTSSIVYDSDGIKMQIDYFKIADYTFEIHYTMVNKTNTYVMAYLKDNSITLDTTVFDTDAVQACYIAPYGCVAGKYSVSLDAIQTAGLISNEIKSVSIPVIAFYLGADKSILMDADVKREVTFG